MYGSFELLIAPQAPLDMHNHSLQFLLPNQYNKLSKQKQCWIVLYIWKYCEITKHSAHLDCLKKCQKIGKPIFSDFFWAPEVEVSESTVDVCLAFYKSAAP